MSTHRPEAVPADDCPAPSEPRQAPSIPALFAGLVDDAAVFPPGSATLPDAVVAHRRHRNSWYADLVGPLLIPASALAALPAFLGDDERIEVGVIADVPLARLAAVCEGADARIRVRQIEAAVAKRGEDPQPGIDELLRLARRQPSIDFCAEVPLAWGLLAGLDTVAGARAAGTRVAAKFRTGGLAAELFPTPVELAAVICACRDRDLPFKLTAGLHHAVRHTDPQTGFTHHGFLNVLVAAAAVADGAEVAEVADLLGGVDPNPLAAAVRAGRDRTRPLWVGFGSCSIEEPLTDLISLRLLSGVLES